MGSGQSDSYTAGKDRVDLNRAVGLRFSKFQDFLTEIAGNISPGGMFISSNSPRSPGEQFEFECSLADGFPLVRGRAEVVWVRRLSTSAEEPCGMGVRFLELMDDSEALIRRIVEEQVKVGETPFDLEDEGSGLDTGAEEATPAQELSDEILAATERLVEEKVFVAPSEERPQELAAETFLDAVSLPSTSESPRVSQPEAPEALEAAELDVLELHLEELPEPESTKPTVPAEADPVHEAEPPKSSPQEPEATETSRSPAVTLPRPQGPLPSGPVPSPPEPESSGIAPVAEPDSVSVPERATAAAPALTLPGPAARIAQARSARKRLGFGRFLELVVFALLVSLCMILVFNQFWVRPRIESLEARLGELTGSSRIGGPPGAGRAARDKEPKDLAAEENPAEARTPKPLTDAGAQPIAVADESPPQMVHKVVRDWANAWSGRRVDEYLAYYSRGFVPASGVTRPVWEGRRRDRLLNQGSIRVAVVSLEVQEVSRTEARVTFTQSYHSDTFRDRVRKTLRMVWEDDAWKIAEEVVVRQLPW